MAGQRRMTVVNIGDVATVRFNEDKIVDTVSIEEMGTELCSRADRDTTKLIILDFDRVEFLASNALVANFAIDPTESTDKYAGYRGRWLMDANSTRPFRLNVQNGSGEPSCFKAGSRTISCKRRVESVIGDASRLRHHGTLPVNCLIALGLSRLDYLYDFITSVE